MGTNTANMTMYSNQMSSAWKNRIAKENLKVLEGLNMVPKQSSRRDESGRRDTNTPLRSLAILSRTTKTTIITTITTAAGSPRRARPDHQLAPRGPAHVLAAPPLLHPASRVIPSHRAAHRTELTRRTGTNRVAGLQD